MSGGTGENEHGLRMVADLTRGLSMTLLALHFYYYCGRAFESRGLTSEICDRLLLKIERTGVFNYFPASKWMALGLLFISLWGTGGKKKEGLRFGSGFLFILTGLVLYFGSYWSVYLGLETNTLALVYIAITTLGYFFLLRGGALLSRVIKKKLTGEVFNRSNETFPQEERLLQNAYSINLPSEYEFRGRLRRGWVNFVNPRRGLLIMGSPGSGKSWFIIENIITQQIEKGFSEFIYDFKYPDLTLVAYNHFLRHGHRFRTAPAFYSVNFSDLSRSHRCNPLNPEMMTSILDAIEASKTILLSINKTWAARQGDFFVESPINFLAAVIWYLRKYNNGEFCTLPHVIELLQIEYNKLFTLLNAEPEVKVLINPFINAYLSDVMETVEGQIASVKIPMGRLSSAPLYYILSGNDFTLDINNPHAPKIVCLGNDPVKSEALSPVISLICDRMAKIINQKGKLKSSIIFDEFGTIRAASVSTMLMTGRSNNIVVVMALQDFSMLKKAYSREEAETILNATGNVIFGQVSGETARHASERFPKIFQDRESISINSSDVSINKSKHLDPSIPASTIASLSSGEFVGLVADDPDSPIELKTFHCRIVRDNGRKKTEQGILNNLPVVRQVNEQVLMGNFRQISRDIQDLVSSEIERISSDPSLAISIVHKP